MIVITITGDGIPRFRDAVKALGSEARAGKAYSRAVNRVGDMARTATGRALAQQTGLKPSTTRKAMNNIRRARATALEYVIEGQGGFIALEHFSARETRPGASAAPRNRRQVFAGAFIKGGRFPNRKTLAMGGNVFKRTGSGRAFEKVLSDVAVPREMVIGASADAFTSKAELLGPRVQHEISVMTKGVVS
jgi:hypothetical protein